MYQLAFALEASLLSGSLEIPMILVNKPAVVASVLSLISVLERPLTVLGEPIAASVFLPMSVLAIVPSH